MDKLTCNIVRDLMPLVLDDVASADSRQGVEEHIENCETCRAYFEGMSMQISRAGEPVSDKSFAQFCKDLKKRSKIKKVLLSVLIVILVGIIGVTGIAIFNNARYTYEDMPISGATAQLYLDKGDVVMLDVRTHGDHEYYWHYKNVNECGDDEVIIYLTPVEPRMKLGNRGDKHRREEMGNYVWKDGQLYLQQDVYNDYGDYPKTVEFKVLSLRWGTPEDNVELYNEGDIPANSPDEDYIQDKASVPEVDHEEIIGE